MDDDETAVFQNTGRISVPPSSSGTGRGPPYSTLGRLPGMEAFFIALMVAVVLLTGWVSIVVLYKLLKADNS